MDPVKNFAKVVVSQGYDDAATSIVLSSGGGAELPSPASDGAFNLVWWNSSDYSDPADDPSKEIIRCTARSTDTLTVTRAQEGTSAVNHNIVGKTYKMILSVTKKTIDDIKIYADAISSDLVEDTTPQLGGDLDTNGHGIAFPATAVPSADANTLDDYEEGTFPAGLEFGGGTTGLAYSENTYKYQKIGNKVTISGRLVTSSKGSSVGDANFTGLPFTIGASAEFYSSFAFFLNSVSFADSPQIWASVNDTDLLFYEITNAGVTTTLTDANFADVSIVAISGSYFI